MNAMNDRDDHRMKSSQPIVWMIGALSWLVLVTPHARADTGHAANAAEGNRPWRLGVKAGPNVTTYGGEHADGEIVQSDHKLGFVMGGYASVELHSLLRVASEIALATRGTRIVIDGEDVGSDDLKYLQIPILVQAMFPFSGKIRPYGLVGGAVSVLLSATEESNQGNTTDIKDRFAPVDVSLLLGIGTQVEITSQGALILEVRYVRGLRDVFDEDMPPDIALENRALSVLVGYQYRFGG